jgi:hypothetical protein
MLEGNISRNKMVEIFERKDPMKKALLIGEE